LRSADDETGTRPGLAPAIVAYSLCAARRVCILPRPLVLVETLKSGLRLIENLPRFADVNMGAAAKKVWMKVRSASPSAETTYSPSSMGPAHVRRTWWTESALKWRDSATWVNAVSVSGNAAVFCSKSGAYVFVLNDGADWEERARLTATDAPSDEYPGSSIAVDRRTVVVGAPGPDADGVDRGGAIYLYELPEW
jgi:hypothetical protein